MVRKGSLGAFYLEIGSIGVSRRIFYRRRTANVRGCLPEVLRSSPRRLLSTAPGGSPGATCPNSSGGRAAAPLTKMRGSIGFKRWQGAAAEVRRSGSQARGLRADAAALHESRPHPLSSPPRRALPHTRERHRGVLVRARPRARPPGRETLEEAVAARRSQRQEVLRRRLLRPRSRRALKDVRLRLR